MSETAEGERRLTTIELYPYEYDVTTDGARFYVERWVRFREGAHRGRFCGIIAVGDSLADVRQIKPDSMVIIGRGQDDDEAYVEVWVTPTDE